MTEKKSYSLIKLKSIYYSNKTQVIKTIRKTEVSSKLHHLYPTHAKQLHFNLEFTSHEQMPALQQSIGKLQM